MADRTPRPPAKKAAAKKPARKAATKKAAPRRRTTKPDPARDRQVLELRRGGVPFDAITKQLDFRSREDTHDAYERALAETLPQPVDELRRLELDRLERLITPLWAKALRGDAAAIAQIAQLSVQRTRVAGEGSPLASPLETEHVPGPTEEATMTEVKRLKVETHPLAASALVMARFVDSSDGGSAIATATASRELRQALNNLHAFAGTVTSPADTKGGDGGKVVPESRLAELRKRSASRGGG